MLHREIGFGRHSFGLDLISFTLCKLADPIIETMRQLTCEVFSNKRQERRSEKKKERKKR
jgi:hypothetical protein